MNKHLPCNRVSGWILPLLLLFCCIANNAMAQPRQVIKQNADATKVHDMCGDMDVRLGARYPDGRVMYHPMATPSGMHTPPGDFSTGAVEHCGNFDVYYVDRNVSNGIGFDDPSLGAARRATFCAVLNYIQTVFDFTSILPTDKLRIYVDESYEHLPGFYAPTGTTYLARAIPQYNPLPNALIGGYMRDYITGLGDLLASTEYHADIQVNFDTYNYQDDYTAPYINCAYDLFSILLHEMGHSMGFFSLVSFPSGGPFVGLAPSPTLTGSHSCSRIDNSIWVGPVFPVGSIRSKLIITTGSAHDVDATLLCNNDYWINNNDAPDNYGMFSGSTFGAVKPSQYLSHLEGQEGSYAAREHISPGDRLGPVMSPFTCQGVQTREFSKADIYAFVNALGYTLRPTFVTAHPHIYTNHLPFSKKNAIFPLGPGWVASEFIETVTADYPTLVNGPGVFQNVLLADPTFTTGDLEDHDPGDHIYIDLATLTNISGCGSVGGNDHAQLTPIMSGGNCIGVRYTPRPDFIGRAQFAFNVTDGHERGGYRVVTIDVTQGAFPPVPPIGANMVVNGSFEAGTEMKIQGPDELKPFSIAERGGFWEGKWFGKQIDDGHPYCFHNIISFPYGGGTIARDCYVDCHFATIIKEGVGCAINYANNPMEDLPLPIAGGGNRYQNLWNGYESYYNLTGSVTPCNNYTLEFDTYFPHLTAPADVVLKIGFTNTPVGGFVYPTFNYDFSYTIHAIPGVWQHVTIPFFPCGTTSSKVLYLQAPVSDELSIDNLSLMQNVTPPLTVAITQTALPGCLLTLAAIPHDVGCGATYLWSGPGIGGSTTSSVTVPANLAATYGVTVSDGCGRTATATSVVADVIPDPITGPTHVCEGSNITLLDATPGGAWTSSNTSIATAGIGTGIVHGVLAGTVTISYTVFCSRVVTYSIAVDPNPTAYTVTGGGVYCIGSSGVHIGLSGSDAGINYQLYYGTTAVGALVPGTGAALDFGLFMSLGTYTVVAIDATTGCTSTMLGSVSVSFTLDPLFTVTGGGVYCTGGLGRHVGLSGSAVGINYQLFLSYVAIGAPIPGTGAALDFGAFTGTGWYTVDGTNTTTGCVRSMTGGVVITESPALPDFSVTGGGSSCAFGPGVHIGLAGSSTLCSYQLYYAGSPVGSSIIGTGSAIDFGSYSSPGIYTVIATSLSSGCTSLMSGSATVVLIPWSTTWYTVGYSGHYCAGGTGVPIYMLGGSDVGISYQLYRGATAVGLPVLGTGSMIAFGPQTTAGTYTVRGTEVTTGCYGYMAGSATVSIDPLPAVYTVIGGGSSCSGGPGFHIGLSNSDVGINYQLLLGMTPVGSPLPGTGTTLDFGLISVSGIYTVRAIDATTGCIRTMAGSATISVFAPPTAFSITGGGSYCTGGSGVPVGLSNSQLGVDYELYIGGSPTGSVVAGTGSAISFGLQTIVGTYTIVATDVTSGCTATMTGSVSVSVSPLPVIYSITYTGGTGGGHYCAGGIGIDIGLSGSDVGISYQLYRAAIPIGPPVMGTGSAISFGFQTMAGGYIVIATDPATGCSSMMSGVVIITVDPLPMAIVGPGSVCVGSTILLTDGTSGGAWSSSSISVAPVSPGGVVSGLSVGSVTIAYTLPTTCSVTHSVIVDPTPGAITGPNSVCIGHSTTLSSTTTGGTWTSGDPSIATISPAGVATGISVGMTGTPPGISMITYTVGGCSVSAPVYVYNDPTDCGPCNLYGGAAFTTLTGSLATNLGAGYYYMIGNVTVSGSVTMTNCVVNIEPGLHIDVAHDAFLKSDGSHLFSCRGMWDGIVLLSSPGVSSGRLELTGVFGTNSTCIEDAITAVDIHDAVAPSLGTYLLMSNNTVFNRNNTGINIVNYHEPTPTVYPFGIANTVFTCRDFSGYNVGIHYPMSWPTVDHLKAYWNPSTIDPVYGPYQAPYNIANPDAFSPGVGYPIAMCHNMAPYTIGINLSNVGSGTSGYSGVVVGAPNTTILTYVGGPDNIEKNLFENVNYGILGVNSNLTTYNNVFANMRQHFGLYSTGYGIKVVNEDGGHYNLDIEPGSYTGSYGGPPVTVTSPNYFYDCLFGVHANGYYTVKGYKSYMISSQNSVLMPGHYGYQLSSSVYDNVDVNENTIINVANGINYTSTYVPSYLAGGPDLYYWTFPYQYAGNININSNNIKAALGVAPPTWQFNINSIYVWNDITDLSMCYPTVTGVVNTNSNIIKDSRKGISVNNYLMQTVTSGSNNVTVKNYLAGPGFLSFGISHINCDHDFISSNAVAGADVSALSDDVRAFYAQDNKYLNIGCNNASETGRLFEFANDNRHTIWHDNRMHSSVQGNIKGLVLNGGIIDAQGDATHPQSNIWLGPGTSTVWDILQPQTYVIAPADPTLSPLYVLMSAGPIVHPVTNDAPFGSTPYADYISLLSSTSGTGAGDTYPFPCGIDVAVPIGGKAMPTHEDSLKPADMQDYTLQPNPSDGNITLKQSITDDQAVMIAIWDASGRVVLRESRDFKGGAANVRLNDIASGLYLIQVTDAKGKEYKFKFIVER